MLSEPDFAGPLAAPQARPLRWLRSGPSSGESAAYARVRQTRPHLAPRRRPGFLKIRAVLDTSWHTPLCSRRGLPVAIHRGIHERCIARARLVDRFRRKVVPA